MTRTAILYQGTIDIRFSDLDTYGHVNSKNYLDFVSTTRLRYLDENMPVSNREIMKRGFAFYMKRSEIRYRRPISGIQTILVESFVAERDKADLNVQFQIKSSDQKYVYAEGSLIFSLVEFQNGRPVIDIPDWIMDLFFQDKNDES